MANHHLQRSFLIFSAARLIFGGVTCHADQWLAGDLHVHSRYSDGDSTVDEVIKHAETLGLDFLSISDHDVLQIGTPRQWRTAQHQSDKLTLLYGMEWTTLRGHANIFSSEPFRYRVPWFANLTGNLALLLRFVSTTSNPMLVSANHPRFGEVSWHYRTSNLSAIEVWNGTFDHRIGNRKAITDVFDPMTKRTLPPVALGGSDTHKLRGEKSIGNPTTWVLSATREGSAIISAIMQRRVTISCAPQAPRLNLQLLSSDRSDIIAETGGLTTGKLNESFYFRVSIVFPNASTDALENGLVVLFRNGKIVNSLILNSNTPTRDIAVRLSESAFQDGARGVYRAELHVTNPDGNPLCPAENGSLTAMTNPIFIDRAEITVD